jgi:hypothetical protein
MSAKPDPLAPDQIDIALRRVAERVIQTARQTGTPIVVWEDGQVRKVSVEDWEKRLALRAAGSSG